MRGIAVLAATNRPDKLDTALTRPGRLTGSWKLACRTKNGRLRILHTHAVGKPLAPEVNLERLAEDTVGFSGAKLETMLNEAALRAARRDSGADHGARRGRRVSGAVGGARNGRIAPLARMSAR